MERFERVGRECTQEQYKMYIYQDLETLTFLCSIGNSHVLSVYDGLTH